MLVQGKGRHIDRDQKDIERLDRLLAPRIAPANAESRLMLLLEQLARVNRRAMIMEYIYFVLSIAAICFCVLLSQKSRFSAHTGRVALTKPRGSGVNTEPAPPLKKTVSGPSEHELESLEQEKQVEKWRKADPIQRRWTHRSADPLGGRKYVYVPRKKTSIPSNQVAQQKVSTSINGNRFQLIG